MGNDIEKEILDANPTRNPNFDFSDDAYFEEYILKHKDDFDFMVQVAKVQGDNCINLDGFSEISVLLAERPLVILEAVQHFDKNLSAMPYYMLNYFDAIGETNGWRSLEGWRNLTTQEHKNLVFDFIREKFAPFENNPDLVYELCKKIDYELPDLRDDMQKLKEEFDSYGMLSPYAKADLKEEKIFTSQELSPEEVLDLVKIEMAERVAEFKQKYNAMSGEELLQMVERAKENTHCPCLVKNGDVEYLSGLNAIILASKMPQDKSHFIFRESKDGNIKILNAVESDIRWVGKYNSQKEIKTNPREDFKFEMMLDNIKESLAIENGDKIDFCKIVEEAESKAIDKCGMKVEDYLQRIEAIRNIDVNAKPKTNAEKLQFFCKKAMEAHSENYVADGVKSFLLTTPSVKLEQMTKLIDYVAPDAVYNTQVNKYSDVVKEAVREDDVFRNRLKIAKAKGSGVSR